jgi:hypothetical protein
MSIPASGKRSSSASYRIAGALKARFLQRRALADLMTYPRQATRIAGYIRATGSAAEYLRFLESVESHPENVYPDVSHAFVEGLLRIEATPARSRGDSQTCSQALEKRDQVRVRRTLHCCPLTSATVW